MPKPNAIYDSGNQESTADFQDDARPMKSSLPKGRTGSYVSEESKKG